MPRNRGMQSKERLRRQQYTTKLFESFNKPRKETQAFGAGLDTSMMRKLQMMQAIQNISKSGLEKRRSMDPSFVPKSQYAPSYNQATGERGLRNPISGEIIPEDQGIFGDINSLVNAGTLQVTPDGKLAINVNGTLIPITSELGMSPSGSPLIQKARIGSSSGNNIDELQNQLMAMLSQRE